MKIIQIGANKGHDDVYNFLTGSVGIDFVLLVEPLSFHIEDLKKCYKDFQNVYIEQVAVVPKEQEGKIKIYYNPADGPGYEISSLDLNSAGGENNTKFEEVEAKTLTQLLDKYKITQLDFLFIDAEGSDDDIVMSLDLDKYSIKYIEYEHLHVKHGNSINTFLESKGYKSVKTIPSKDSYNSAYSK
jgi:FkbM family methyltransferase